MSEQQCVIGKPHGARVGYLCDQHLEQIGVMLREIEEQAILLSAVPSLQQRTGNRGGSLASQRTPVRLEVLVHNDPRSRPAGECPVGPACVECWHDTCIDVRSWWDAYDARATEILSVLDVLGSWARAVRDDDERQLSWPAHATVTTERDLLTRQLPWIAEQPWVDEFDGDLRKLLGQLKAVNGTRADRPYSYCPVITAGEQCVGQVWVQDELQPVWRRYPDRCTQTWEHAPGSAVCDTCGAAWITDSDKARLSRMISDAADEITRPRTADGEPMFTAAEIARDRGVSVNAIRLRLSKLHIKAEHGSYYDPNALVDQAS